jgi:hypothetical protein
MNRYLCIRRYLYAAICVYAYLKLDENCVYAMYAKAACSNCVYAKADAAICVYAKAACSKLCVHKV